MLGLDRVWQMDTDFRQIVEARVSVGPGAIHSTAHASSELRSRFSRSVAEARSRGCPQRFTAKSTVSFHAPPQKKEKEIPAVLPIQLLS
jgi:hypothetical protein